jgi:sugar phosphate isomerase/epimerase
MIFVSTGGVRDKSAAQTALDLSRQGIPAVELSGGAYSANFEVDLLNLRRELVLQVHNYFPPPEQSFVFNLASSEPALLDRSLRHVRSAMRLALILGRGVYSFHAGFRINPKVSELGRPLELQALRDRGSALEQFGESVLRLAEEARRDGVTLLVENNVLSAANMAKFGEDPLLLTHPDEICAFMPEMPANVGLLLDVAHLKVSARTLGFDPVAAHSQVKRWIRGYHLSDNDGTEDSNQPLSPDSWFWDVIDPEVDYYTLEVYTSAVELAKQYQFVKAKLAERTRLREVAS